MIVSGTNQAVGNIDGSGAMQVNAGSDLSANHIIQSALLIGGTSSSHGLLTIDSSNASGNPLGQSDGFALGGSLASSGLAGMNNGGGSSSVPEPSTLVLILLAITGLTGQRIAIRHVARRTGV
jgi:hypothetical protein